MKNVNVLMLSFLSLLMLSCGGTSNTAYQDSKGYENDFQVKSFWNQFDKAEFISEINSKRNNAYEYVTALKNKNVVDGQVISLYNEAAMSYNSILSKMSNDISKVNNIVDFTTFSATNLYQNDLQDAEKKEAAFINAASNILYPEKETSFFGDLFNAALSFIPGANAIQEIYLSSLKNELQNKINDAKWGNWNATK